ncbi:uncharacterized protein LOC129730697 [Wyeomyia smithii]|uniref:uncharacterized protein LOC129730697 n=1 Tax=Wyeomyia smithii TaxID=174621 RepID=UPI002467EC30|nr:uncharacterized protein LOC129730697 [Wyeomyia smithii]
MQKPNKYQQHRRNETERLSISAWRMVTRQSSFYSLISFKIRKNHGKSQNSLRHYFPVITTTDVPEAPKAPNQISESKNALPVATDKSKTETDAAKVLNENYEIQPNPLESSSLPTVTDVSGTYRGFVSEHVLDQNVFKMGSNSLHEIMSSSIGIEISETENAYSSIIFNERGDTGKIDMLSPAEAETFVKQNGFI